MEIDEVEQKPRQGLPTRGRNHHRWAAGKTETRARAERSWKGQELQMTMVVLVLSFPHQNRRRQKMTQVSTPPTANDHLCHALRVPRRAAVPPPRDVEHHHQLPAVGARWESQT